MSRNLSHQSKRGFSLIELLVAIFIIIILTTAILVSLAKSREKSRDNKRKTDLAVIQQGLEMYYADQHQFPPGSCTNVSSLSTDPSSQNDFSKYVSPVPADPYPSLNISYKYNLVTDTNNFPHYIIVSTLENRNDSDYDKALTGTYWATANDACVGGWYGAGKNYHYFVSSD
ncbi:MAG TPA: prepilin-type N-terminal cleavage/methylation domain-containing protein [Patescibacteria group bacterium]|nr:prepilin-type N-terminal cleavage/methylation domain-containing protein [Patescibacteria group bacterium]